MAATDFTTLAIRRDGRSIRIRALRYEDRDQLLQLFQRLSPRSVYFRFFRSKGRLTEGELAQMTELDFVRTAAIVACLREHGEEQIIGVGRYSAAGPDAPRRAEVSFAVEDGHQGNGVGTLLLEQLIPIALSKGITEFQADVLGDNDQMLRVFSDSGFKVTESAEDGITRVSFPISPTDEAEKAQFRRERHATAQSVRLFLEPRSIAVVGASRKPGTISYALVDTLRKCGFQGHIYPVNPNAAEICGFKAYPGMQEIGAAVEMALIAVPAPLVEKSIDECGRAGVGSVVVISSGFGETSPEGRQAERRLCDLARSSGMRMVGANCMGVLNRHPDVSMNATFVPTWPPPGNIGMLSQSGALGYTILERVQAASIGLSNFVSVGNTADVSGTDLLAYWAEDPHTDVVVLYLESFTDARRFLRAARELTPRKPIVAVKAGRSTAGARAASSHTAALASLDVAVDALFAQSGIIRTDTIEQLMDVATLLSMQPVPPGRRVGIITNAGGAGILLADACEGKGLLVPELAPETLQALRRILPTMAGLANPVDVIPSANGEQYAAAVRLIGNDPNVDSVIVIYIPPQLYPPEVVANAIAESAADVPLDKPVMTVVMSSRDLPPMVAKGPRGRLPSYNFPENAALALSAAERYARWRKRRPGCFLALEHAARVREVVDRILASATAPVWVEPGDVASILRAAGLEVAVAVSTPVADASDAAERMGYPLVAKIDSREIIHKSDIGGVILGLQSRDEVCEAVRTLKERTARLGGTLEKILLQREVRGGVEALVGVAADPTFGHLVACGLGGVLVEVLKDVSFRLTPVSDVDAEEMIAELRSVRLLDGYRGTPAADKAALARIIQQVSALAEIVPELRELDLNPVKVLDAGRGAVVVDTRMRLASSTQHP